MKSPQGCSNITKKSLLCLDEKLEIITYPNHEELLNKQSELISNYRDLPTFKLQK